MSADRDIKREGGAPIPFGVVLRAWRTHRGLSLRDLAMRTPYSHVYLWQIEKGLNPPTRKLCRWVDVALNAGGALRSAAGFEPDFGDVPGVDSCPTCGRSLDAREDRGGSGSPSPDGH